MKKYRYLLWFSNFAVFGWDLLLRLYRDLQYLGGENKVHYFGVYVPDALLVSIWFSEIIAMVGLSIIIREFNLSMLRPMFGRFKTPEILKYFCENCGAKFAEPGIVVNLTKTKKRSYCPDCKEDLGPETSIETEDQAIAEGGP